MLTEVVGSEGLLTLTSEWAVRHFHGVLSRFERHEQGRRLTVYHATLVPLACRLLHRFDCRIKGNGGKIEISPTGVTTNGITVDIN